MSADVIAGLVQVLKDDPAVAALAGARVFGLELPPTEAKAMPRKAIVLRASGGASLAAGATVEHDSQRVDLMAYGETPFEAARLRRTAADAFKGLQRQVSAGTLIHWVEPAGGFATERDPDAAWPLAFQSFQAFYAEPEIVS